MDYFAGVLYYPTGAGKDNICGPGGRQACRSTPTPVDGLKGVKQMKRRFCVFLLLLLFPLGCGGISYQNLKVSSLMQKKRHHEVIRMLQPEVDRHAKISSFQLFLLAGAYYEIRDYNKVATTVDLMEKQIVAGDNRYFTIDLTAYPRILLGLVALDQGQADKAIAEASDAYAYLNRSNAGRNDGYIEQMIGTAGILGVACAELGRKQEAESWLNTLYNIDTSSTESGGGINGPGKFVAIAKIHMALKQYDKALAAVEHPEARVGGLITAFYDQTFQELPRFFILTKSRYETGAIAAAREGYDQLLKHPQIRQVGGIYWPVLLDRAKIARTEQQPAVAEALLREAVGVIEKQRASISTEAGRIGYVGDKQAVYQELVALLVDQHRSAEAFEYVERAKGRALVDLLAAQKQFAVHAADPNGARETLAKIAAAEQRLEPVVETGSEPALSSTRAVAINLKKDLATRAPELASLVMVTKTSVREIQARLSKDETLVEYYACGKEWIAWVVRRGDVRAVRLGIIDVENEVREFRAALANPASNAYLGHARSLYRKLYQPLERLVETEHLIIVPHGPLHYLPFGALQSGRDYVIDRVSLRFLPAATVLTFLKDRSGEKSPSMLIMANPDLGDPRYDLKYAQAEAIAIARITPGATLLLRDDARAAVMKTAAGRFGRIHLAAHGAFDPDGPLGSALLLAGSDGDPGLLQAADLFDLNLAADLVTLSACDTALGKITQGDDVVGFTRGFLYAGASSIIATLWKVDDRATMELMVSFYSRLPTATKDEALRAAQLEVRNRYPHPYFWASFQLTGNAKSPKNKD